MNRVESADIVNLDDIWMDERSRRTSFLEKSLFVFIRTYIIRSQDFERYVSMKGLLECEIDLGHAANSEPMENRITPDGLIGEVIRVARSGHPNSLTRT